MTHPFLRDTVRPFADIQTALDELEAHLENASLRPVVRMRLHAQIGALYRTSPEPARAIPHFESAIALARTHNLRADEAVHTLRLAVACQYAGQIEAATAAFRAAIELHTQRGMALDSLYHHWGKFLVEQGEVVLAVPFLEQALRMRMGKGDPALTASTRDALHAAERLMLHD